MIALFGGTGLLGSHIAYALYRLGYDLRIAFRTPAAQQNVRDVFALYGEDWDARRIEFFPLDFPSVESCRRLVAGAEVVVNAAAQVSLAGYGRRSAEALVRHNEDLTAHLAEACLMARIPQLIHIGSIAALGSPDAEGVVREASVPASLGALTPYARSKVAAERQVLRAGEEGLRVHILNPGVVLAPVSRRGSSAELVEWAMRGSRFYPSGLLAWVDARDVAQAVCRLAECPDALPSSSRITLVSGEASYYDFLRHFAAAGGGVRPRYCVSEPMVKWLFPFVALGRLLRLVSPSLSSQTILSAYSRSRYEGRLAALLGVKPHILPETIHFITIQKK